MNTKKRLDEIGKELQGTKRGTAKHKRLMQELDRLLGADDAGGMTDEEARLAEEWERGNRESR